MASAAAAAALGFMYGAPPGGYDVSPNHPAASSASQPYLGHQILAQISMAKLWLPISALISKFSRIQCDV